MMNNPSEFSMVATGLEFIKHGMRSVETVIDNLFADDTNEIHMLVYSFGDTSLLEPLTKFASKGKIVIIAKDIETEIKVEKPDVYEILLELNRERNVTISDFESYWHCHECDRNIHGSTEKENHQNVRFWGRTSIVLRKERMEPNLSSSMANSIFKLFPMLKEGDAMIAN